MCPLWPLHIVLMYLIALCPLWFVACQITNKAASSWAVKFSPEEINLLRMYKTEQVYVTTTDMDSTELDRRIIVAMTSDPDIANVAQKEVVFREETDANAGSIWKGAFNISGEFLGYTSVKLCQVDKNDARQTCLKESAAIPVTVTRTPRIIDRVFTSSVIILVSIIFINFGCALDVESLKQAVLRPIGPVIGLLSHFLFMPLFSYGLGELLFPESRALRLGLFFTGISPAGGASNIWTYVLGGNLNLSVTMSAISTLAAFAMIPLWVFTLGPVIFSGGSMGVPHSRIITSAVGLIVPLAIGYLLQVYCKKFSAVMVRILKPFSSLLIVFIVVFATVTNLYLFKLFTWEILVAGFGLPFLGYLAGYILAVVLRQPGPDTLAISIETGVQNTGIAIFLLRFCLPQPDADLTTVAPVAVALMTPIPLLLLYLVRSFLGYNKPKKNFMEANTLISQSESHCVLEPKC